MAIVKPFRAIRPVVDKVHLVPSHSVDSYSPGEIKALQTTNPYSFLHIIQPEHEEEIRNKPNSTEILLKIKNQFNLFRQQGILIQDQQDCFYIYQQIQQEGSFTGIIGCSSVSDYLSGTIKIHEQTLAEREEKLKNYLEVCDFNAEPVCMSYPDDESINALVREYTQQRALYDFTGSNDIRHRVWMVSDPKDIQTLAYRFQQLPAIYIADGHHRSASSALLAKTKQQQVKNFSGGEDFNYFLCIYFPETQLKIYDYNRVVKDLNGLSAAAFLEKLSEKFTVEEKGTTLYRATGLHNFSMYLENKWYSLTAKPILYDNEHPVKSLDAAILSKHLLDPILNIKDLRTDKRISFVSGIRGMEKLKLLVDSGKAKVAFGLYPVTLKQIKKIADTGNVMPPKTTWVEPKLKSGLIIYSLSDSKEQ